MQLVDVLGEVITDVNDSSEAPLSQMGVDSLSAVRLQSLMKEKFKVDVPLTALFGQDATLQGITKIIDDLASKKDVDIGSDHVDWDKEVILNGM
jgi:acyl carrier protein